MLRTVLWGIAGGVALFFAAFTVVSILLGGARICGPSPADGGCSAALGLVALAAAPVGAVLFGWLSRVDAPTRRKPRLLRFGRMAAAPDRLGKR